MTDTVMTWEIGEAEAGARLDVAVSGLLPDLSRSYVQKLIAKGLVTVDGVPATVKKEKVAEGQIISVTLPPAKPPEAEPEDIPLDIVYEDEDLLVVNKPRGMVVHPAPGNETGTLVNALLYHCRGELSAINGVERPGIVHRIDKDTSGLLMVAKSDAAHKGLSEQLAVHSITREYLALCYNNFTEDAGTCDVPIGRDPQKRVRQSVYGSGERNAVTHYQVLERFGTYTYIRARLETGRTHQIRVHMAYLHHPLVGDELYGRGKNPFGVKGQLLHAATLGFTHPVTGEDLLFTAPVPEVFRKVLDRLRNEMR